MRQLAFFAVLWSSIAFMVSGQPNNGADTENSRTKKEPAPSAGQDNNAPGHAPPDGESPHWYTALERPDWWIVIIAALTGGAIAYQAKLQSRSINLQERQMQQWVDLCNWESAFYEDQGQANLSVEVELTNPTSFPLTLPFARIIFTVDGVHNLHPVPENRRLLPSRPQKLKIGLPLRNSRTQQFLAGLIAVEIEADLTYIDMRGNRVPQVIYGFLYCRSDGTVFQEFARKTERHDGQRPDQDTTGGAAH